MWRDLIAGIVTREEVHSWAAPWVEERWDELPPLVEGAMQTLHGFDITYDVDRPNLMGHGPGGPGDPYYHADAHIREQFALWQADCARFDADPDAQSR
jgi:hypothetical protein